MKLNVFSLMLYASSAFADEPLLMWLNVSPEESVRSTIQYYDVCPQEDKGEYKKCKVVYETKIKDRHLPMYDGPSYSSKVVGSIKSEWRVDLYDTFFLTDKAKVKLQPDGAARNEPWIDFTVEEVKGNWIKLRKYQFGKSYWVNPKEDWKLTDTLYKDYYLVPLVKESYMLREPIKGYKSKTNLIVVESIDEDSVTLFEAIVPEGGCVNDPSVPNPNPRYKVKKKDLFDKDGRLKIYRGFGGC